MKRNKLESGGTPKVATKRIVGFIVAVVLIALFTLIPPFEGLTEPGMASIGVFLAAIVLFVCQVAPLAGTAGGLISTLDLLGAKLLPGYVASAIAGTNRNIFFMILGLFAIPWMIGVFLLPKSLDVKG